MGFSVPIRGGKKEDGNWMLFRICRELSVRGRRERRLLSTDRWLQEFRPAAAYWIEEREFRETHPPGLFARLLRARGLWTFLFGEQAMLAEERWRQLAAGCAAVTLCWYVALVVAEK